MKSIIIILALLLGACGEEKPCVGPFIYIYVPGEKAIHRQTGETVRVIKTTYMPFSNTCQRRKNAAWTIKFDDGTVVFSQWRELSQIKNKP